MNIELSEHKSSWNNDYQIEAKIIRETLSDNFIEMHHIGSTSIVNLVAKPQIDIVASVNDLDQSIEALRTIGYVYKGEFNIPFRYFFGKHQESLKFNLHVVGENDPEILGFLTFRNYMRNHPDELQKYADLKKSIVKEPGSEEKHDYFTEYTLLKDDFIRSILKKAGFNGLCMRFVAHYNEENYEQTVCKLHNCIINPNDKRFIFYSGPDIVGYANVSVDKKITIFEITEPSAHKYFEDRLNKYLNR